jgi:hypothetical protein
LATVVLAAVLIVAPRGVGVHRAFADIMGPVPTPLISDIIGEPKPEESEDPGSGGGGSEDPGDGSGGGDGSGSGGGSGTGGGGDGSGKGGDGKGGGGRNGGDGGLTGNDGRNGQGKNKSPVSVVPPSGTPLIPGAFNTNQLMAVAAHLRALGWSAQEVIERVYPPFIIAGEATWVDTWGAPRYGPGPIVRTHEGQDVFCDYGDPVLAPESGYVSFSDGGLGGITARVHTPDGAYWYLTHLSDLNTEELSAGEQVRPGAVLGYCGNSGNAATTPPHVHFGWYQPNGVAKNPMSHLIDWLREAEDNASTLLASVQGQRQKQLPTLTAARRFGDAFAPDRSVLSGGAGESLWASGSSPATGAFALAEIALQAALAERVYEPGAVLVPTAEGAGVEGLLDPESTLAELLKRRNQVDESGD